MLVTELTEGKVDPVPADVNSVFPVQDMLNGMTDASGSLEDFLNSWNDPTTWDLDFPADMTPVQPKLEAGVGGKTVERPPSVYGNKMDSKQQQQPADQCYQLPGSWAQAPHQIAQHIRPVSSHVRMHAMSAGMPSHQHYSSMQPGPPGLTHSPMEIRTRMLPSQSCARQSTAVSYRNMQQCLQRDMPTPRQYLQHRLPPRALSPGLQHPVVANQSAMMHSAVTMSNQLHNLQVMVNNQTNMMHRISPGLGPNGGGVPDSLMHVKMHRSSVRMSHSGRHSAVPNDTHLFQSLEYQSPPNIMHQRQAQLTQNVGNLQDQSPGMLSHSATPGFHNQSSVPPLQHAVLHGGLSGPAVPQSHTMPNHARMMSNHQSVMPAQPELRPNHFPGRSHGMGVMSHMHRGMVHSSGPVRSQMGMPSQQMMMLKQQPMPVQHPGRSSAIQQHQLIIDKNATAHQWPSPCSTPNVMAQPAGVQTRNSPAVNQFTSSVSPAVGNCDQMSSASNIAPFTADIDSLSFLSEPFLSQVPDTGYCGQPQMLHATSAATGVDRVIEFMDTPLVCEFLS